MHHLRNPYIPGAARIQNGPPPCPEKATGGRAGTPDRSPALEATGRRWAEVAPSVSMATRKTKNSAADPTTDRADTPVDPDVPRDVTPPPRFSAAETAAVVEAAEVAVGTPADVGTLPAVAWLSANDPDHVAGYAALLADLRDARPGFLADVDVEADVVGLEGAGRHGPTRSLHTTGATSAAEGAAACAAALDGFRALLESEGAPRFFAGVGHSSPPTWRALRPRLGFRPDRGHAPAALQSSARPGEVVRKCEATERLYALPQGAPVPCLYFDYADESGTDPRATPGQPDDRHPHDRNPNAMDLHPSLAARGPAVVLAACWGRLLGRLEGIAEAIEEASLYASLVAGVIPADVDANEVPRALVVYGRDAETRADVASPAGWRDVGGR